MATVQIIYERQNLLIHIEEDQLSQLYDYNKLKKIVLKQLGFSISNKNNVQLAFKGLYQEQKITPIFFQQNLEFLMDYVLQQKKPIKIVMKSQSQQLILKKKRNKQIIAEFDSQGSIQSMNQDVYKNIIPLKGKYKGQQLVRCAFCNRSNRDKKSNKQLGKFYGPFGPFNKNQFKYFHILCAIWCSDIYLNEGDGQFNKDGLVKTFKKQTSKCIYCGKYKAFLNCHFMTCRNSFHYPCAKQQCQFNWQSYQILCHKCKDDNQRRRALGWQQKNCKVQKMDIEPLL